jgi:hypothetical protein
VNPGRLAQGPEEKLGFAGRTAGFAVIETSIDGLPCRRKASRWGDVTRRGDYSVRFNQARAENRKGFFFVKKKQKTFLSWFTGFEMAKTKIDRNPWPYLQIKRHSDRSAQRNDTTRRFRPTIEGQR